MGDNIWSLFGVLCFWGWVASCFMLIFKPFYGNRPFQSNMAFVWGLIAVLLGAGWVVGLLKA